MSRVASTISILGLVAIGLVMLPVLGLPYGPFDWVVYSQEYGAVENLALNRPAFSSTFLQDRSPTLAVDGNPDTAWESFTGFNEWFYVILDQPQPINQLVINWGDGYAARYRIGVLVGEPYPYWQPIFEETSGDGGVDFITFPSTKTSAVLINMFGPVYSTVNFSIREFEVFYLPIEPQASGNLAAGRPAYATSFLSSYEPTNATDVDLSTGWQPDPVLDPFMPVIFVDLGDTYSIEQVTLHWGDLHPGQYGLYAWSFVWSGPYGFWAWQPIYSGTSTGDEDTATFQSVSTRYVRLVVETVPGQGVELKEFEVYSSVPESPSDSDMPPAGTGGPGAPTNEDTGILRDLMPPGWEDTPMWQQLTPSKGEIPIPSLSGSKF